MPIPRNSPHPPRDRALSGFAGDHSPEGRAAQLLLHPVRRWALTYVRQHGQLTTRDLMHEFPAVPPGAANKFLYPLLNNGALVVLERRKGSDAPHIYIPGNSADLVALRDYLNSILPPTPEVRDETHE